VRRIVAATIAAGALVLGACESDSGDDSVGSGGGYYDPCRNYTSCSTCTPIEGCGWCFDSDGTGMCAASPDECVTPAFSWTWNPPPTRARLRRPSKTPRAPARSRLPSKTLSRRRPGSMPEASLPRPLPPMATRGPESSFGQEARSSSRAPDGRSGSANQKRAPSPSMERTPTCPRCASTRRRTVASPRPRPGWL
jgi:hypothetical protein